MELAERIAGSLRIMEGFAMVEANESPESADRSYFRIMATSMVATKSKDTEATVRRDGDYLGDAIKILALAIVMIVLIWVAWIIF